MAKFENVAEFIIVRVKGSFSIFCGKVEKQLDRWNILKISFDSGKALSYVEYGKKIFACCGKLPD